MLNIFIAVGGSGTKVAEALVRMLAAGFPTRYGQDGVPTSAGDELQIWRLDPDRSSGAAQTLQRAVDEYGLLQMALTHSDAASQWAMELDSTVRHLDPLNLARQTERTNEVKTLGGILNSLDSGRKESTPFLSLFYEPKDLEVEIDRGFYQKPFIGAPIMAIFAELLKDPNSPGGKACNLSFLESQQVRFFLCGSLHGGTGACGLPVMGKFLGEWRDARKLSNWELGGCLLAPYAVPPAPPFAELQDARQFSPELADDYARRFGNASPFNWLPTPEDKRQLAAQILLGFYAHPDAMTDRARQSLVYYKDHVAAHFNALYLVGKPKPDQLAEWSNGGASQQNPINSAEVTAALAALNFFAGAHAGENQPKTYVIGSSTRTLAAERMLLRDLPQYCVAQQGGPKEIDPEKIFLASALLRHLVRHQLPWETAANFWPNELQKLKDLYKAHPEREDDDNLSYPRAIKVITDSINALLSAQSTMGWEGTDHAQLSPLLSDEPTAVESVTENLRTRWMTNEARGELRLGHSSVRVSTREFGGWCPPGTEFSRGSYLRQVWSLLLARMTSAAGQAV
jgi:hypothetical protein